MGVAVVPAVPVESFPVVMATGIIAVAARDTGFSALALVLAVLAGAGLVVLVGWAAVALRCSGRAVAPATGPVDQACGLFGFVAAADVVAAQLDPPASGLVAVLGVAALLAWVGVWPRLLAAARTVGAAALSTSARGGWLLAVVATQSLALTAARLTAAGVATTVLIVVSLVWWTIGVLAYLVIAGLVVWRCWHARLAAALLSPDMWVLMGAVAITVVAGGAVVEALVAVGACPALAAAGAAVVFGCWLAATAWIPVLIAAEVRRAHRPRSRYQPTRWSTVFPLGMYSTACATLAPIAPALQQGLHAVAVAMLGAAMAAWCATAVGMITHLVRRPAAR